jgi:uncharacterized protein
MRRSTRAVTIVLLLGGVTFAYAARTCLAVRAARLGWELPVRVMAHFGLNVNSACGPGKGHLLESATAAGDAQLVRFLLLKGADIDARNSGGYSALMVAAALDEREIAKALIAAGADLNVRTSANESILQSPVHNGHLVMVKLLVSSGGAIGKDSGPLLIEAIRQNRTAVLRVLLDAGADANARGSRGSTPLMWAARFGDGNMLKLLLQHRADLHARDADGRTARDWAMMDDRRGNVSILSTHGMR